MSFGDTPRFQSQVQAAMRRFGGRVLNPLFWLEGVAFVVSLGCDRPDIERPVFIGTVEVSVGGAATPKFGITAETSDIEILGAWASRNGGNLNAAVYFGAPPGGLAPAGTITSSTGAAPTAEIGVGGGAQFAPSVVLENVQDVTLQVPGIAGTILTRGNSLTIENLVGGSTFHGGFTWRTLDGLYSSP